MTELEKRPSEKLHFSMDFSDLLDTGETIVTFDSIALDLQNCSGATGTLASSGNGTSSDGLFATFWLEAGADNETYIVRVVVTTSSAQIRQGEGVLSVREK